MPAITMQSPLAKIDRTCHAVCHRESEETLRNNVYERQRKANEAHVTGWSKNWLKLT